MRFKLSGFLLLAVLLSGCTKMSPMAPLARQNPANASAPNGPAIPKSDFINIADASAQIAPPKVTAGQNLPMAGATVKPSTSPAGGMGSMPGMKGMNMPGMGWPDENLQNLAKNTGGVDREFVAQGAIAMTGRGW